MKIHDHSHPYKFVICNMNLSQSRPSNSSDSDSMKSIIDDIIDRAILPLKDEIRNYMAKCHRFDENERKGGSIGTSWDKLNIIQQNKDEDNNNASDIEQKEDDVGEEEKAFHDIVKKDAKKLSDR